MFPLHMIWSLSRLTIRMFVSPERMESGSNDRMSAWAPMRNGWGASSMSLRNKGRMGM